MRPRRQCSLGRRVDWLDYADAMTIMSELCPPQTVQRLLDVLDSAESDDDVTAGSRLEHMMSLELRDDVAGTER